jgi:hypothetical protein
LIESEITVEDIVNTLAQNGLDTFESAYGEEWRNWVVKQIRRAEARIISKMGQEFDPPPPESQRVNWVLYNTAVEAQVAVKIVDQLLSRESAGAGVTLMGGFEVDVRAISANLKAVRMNIARDIKDLVDLLKKTDNPQMHTFNVKRTI